MSEKAQKITELRDKFFKKLQDDGPPNAREFHPADINRIKSGDDWLRRFLEHNDHNVQESLKMLWESCEWRRNFGTNDINENNVRKDYLEDGVCYSYGKDKDGKKLFIIVSKLHTKSCRDFAELQRCIVFWFERLERETNGDQISLFFDMIDAGYSNLDMDLTKYLIGLFKNYYPNFLNYIIILEMPWVLNAAFNIIKSWLPAKALPKIKFVKKSTLKEYVDPSIALKNWGGNNDYTFKYVSEAQSGGLVNGKVDNRRIHFAGDQVKSEDAILIVEPDSLLTFNKSGNEVIGTISLKNTMSDKNLSYKIKTTSPEKFKVRPSTGILLASQKLTVTIILQPGYTSRNLLPNDRFLIMYLPIKDTSMTAQELVDFWKVNGVNSEQYRLNCCDGSEGVDGFKSSLSSGSLKSSLAYSGGTDYSISSLFTKISRLEERHIKLQTDVDMLKRVVLAMAILIFVLLSWIIYFLHTNLSASVEKQNCYTVAEPIVKPAIESVLPKHDEI